MFIRAKANKSGSYSIQIISKHLGKYEVIESIGVAKTEAEKARLKQAARERLNELQQQTSLPLFTQQDHQISTYLEGSSSPKVTNIGPELILGKLFDAIGLNAIEEPLFRYITLSRLVYPVSKLKTINYLSTHHNIEVSASAVYRFLDRFHQHYKDKVERIVYEHSKKILTKISIVFYDMTTLYFEAEDEDDLRKIGFSKDGKFRNPQIMLGLLVGKNGYPIGYDMFEGNVFEGHTFIPILKRIQAKYNLPQPIVVADSGLLSKENIRSLLKEGYEYIIGARLKNEKKEIKATILEKANRLSEGKTRTLKKDDGTKLIITYSSKRAKKDSYNREKGIRRLEKDISGGKLTKQKINNRGYNKFLQIKNTVNVELDESKIEEDKKWDGLKGYMTNSPLTPKKVVNCYNELWKIEKAFRISKTDLRIRPIFHRKKDRIAAHLCIAFAAYALYKELERAIKTNNIDISPAKAIELSKSIFNITFQLPDSKNQISILNDISDLQKKLLSMKTP